MSTKIFNGFVIKGFDLWEIHQKVGAFRCWLNEQLQTAECRWIAITATMTLDTRALGLKQPWGGKYEKDFPLLAASHEMQDRQKEVERTEQRDPTVDMGFELAFFPMKDGRILGMVFTEQEKWRKAWLRKSFVKEYGYWNNTDRPDGVTKKAWDKRREDWEEALPGDPPVIGIPSMAGFYAQCTRPRGFYAAKDILPHIPDLDTRVRIAVREKMFSQYVQEKQEGQLDASNVYVSMGAFEKWCKTDEGEEAVAKMDGEIRAILAPEVTADLLLGR